jgi:hypothetical protein
MDDTSGKSPKVPGKAVPAEVTEKVGQLVKEGAHDYGDITAEDFSGVRINPDVPPFPFPGLQPTGVVDKDDSLD